MLCEVEDEEKNTKISSIEILQNEDVTNRSIGVDCLFSKIKQLEEENKTLHKMLEDSQTEKEYYKCRLKNMRQLLQKWFSCTQLNILFGEIKNPMWKNEDIQKSITIISNAGERNYELFRNYLPLPSSSTVYRHLQWFNQFFNTGILDLNIRMLKEKYERLNLPAVQQYLAIGFDAKHIVPGVQYDQSTHERTGIATITPTAKALKNNPQQLAKNAVIFMAMGLDPRIKEVVSYELSAESCDAVSLKGKFNNAIIITENRTLLKVR